MATQLAVIDNAPQQVVAFNIRDMERMALAFAQSGLFGVKTPDQALALCLIAHAEGRHPALAARDYDIIQGRPAKKAEAMQRDFISAGGKIEWHELSDSKADATFSHPMGGSVRIDWDLKRGQTAGLGGKDMWKKFPRQMLRSRVVSEGVRTVMPAATSGMYVPEEVQDFAAQEPKPARMARKEADERVLNAQLPDPSGKEQLRAKAEAWVKEHCAEVEGCGDLETLDKIIAKGKAAVAKLDRDHHDLREMVMDAYSAKGEALEAATAAIASPQPETEMGEGFTDEPEWEA